MQALPGLLLLCLFFFPVAAFSQEPFYKDKTITIVVSTHPGGTGDLRIRAQVPFLKKYIPGNPAIVLEFMPGGGGRKAANYIYKTARPDGLTIGAMISSVVPSAVLGDVGVFYDIDRFIYLGAPDSSEQYVFLTRKGAGLNTLEKLRAAPGVRIGAPTVGHLFWRWSRIVAYLLDMKEPKFLTGYSSPELDLAIDRGEVDAQTSNPISILRRSSHWIEEGRADFHVSVEIPRGQKHPRFAPLNLPEIENFARSDRERKILALARNFRLTGAPFVLPPGTPRERAQILQEAMRKTFKDPEFFSNYTKLVGQEATPLMPEEVEKAIRDLPREPDVIDFFKKFSGTDPLPPR